MIRAGDLGTLYGEIVRHWMASEVMPGSAPITSMGYQEIQGIPHIRQLQLFDLDRYLPDDILVKLDRASMSVALEARVPLLDFRIVEFALGLAPRIVEWDSRPKWPLRALLARHVPTHLFERPKAGFGVPLASWLRGELRDWAEALLDPGRIRDQGFFDPAVVATVWAEHQEGDCEWHYHLWDLLMFQSWYDCSFLQHRNMSSCEREVSINQSEPHRRGEPA